MCTILVDGVMLADRQTDRQTDRTTNNKKAAAFPIAMKERDLMISFNSWPRNLIVA